jgi:hypothetical protein
VGGFRGDIFGISSSDAPDDPLAQLELQLAIRVSAARTGFLTAAAFCGRPASVAFRARLTWHRCGVGLLELKPTHLLAWSIRDSQQLLAAFRSDDHDLIQSYSSLCGASGAGLR